MTPSLRRDPLENATGTRPGRPRQRPAAASPDIRAGLVSAQSIAYLQRTAGNAAVSSLLARRPAPARGAGWAVQRSATMDLSSWNNGATETDTYQMGIDALTNDVVGHAWVDIKENQGQGRRMSIGFWPGSLWAAIPTGGTGKLSSPDPHDGEQGHRSSQTINRDRFIRVLNVVNDWEGSWYQILYRNCAHFAKAAWLAGTGSDDGIIDESGPTIWSPGEEGDVIDARNKALGRDPQGNPLPDGGGQ